MEILIVVAILAFSITSLLGLISLSLTSSLSTEHTTQADELAKETMEQVRNFRDGTNWDTNGLGTLSIGSDYYPKETGSPAAWQMISGTDTSGEFSKKVVFSNANRDANDNIVSSGGTVDTYTKKITVTISWEQKGKDYQRQLITYLTDWKK